MPLHFSTETPTWGELLLLLNTADNRPVDVAWGIYRYLAANYRTLGSQSSRTLLATYMKLPGDRPSRLHSCILGVALKISKEYPDFRLAAFLNLWGYPANLRPDDMKSGYTQDGVQYASLCERTESAIRLYVQRQSASTPPPAPQQVTATTPPGTTPMAAVKIWDTGTPGHTHREVKLVSACGDVAKAEIHTFPVRPSEVLGRVYDVRMSGRDVRSITLSRQPVATLFPPLVGFVDRFDRDHFHYHIYDSISRHFVAEAPKVSLQVGSFVVFSPVVPARDRFKSAIVHSVMDYEEGLQAFGTYEAEVTVAFPERGYFSYRITSPLRPTPEGTVTPEGTASLNTFHDIDVTVTSGERIRILLYLTRRRDGTKQNFVAMTWKLGKGAK